MSYSPVPKTLFAQIASKTIANTIVETSLLAAGVGSAVVPKNFLVPGRSLVIKAQGFMSDTGTPTFTFRFKLGATVILVTATTLTGAISNNQWRLEINLTCRSVGVGGTVIAQALFVQETGGNPDNFFVTSLTPVVLDTTVDNAADLTWQWGTADPADTITCTNLLVEAA